jgi:hypothetical protein
MGKRFGANPRLFEPMVDYLSPSACAEEERQSCFGFRVSSSCSLRFLRKGSGQETLEITELAGPFETPGQETLLFEWTLRDPSADVTARLYGSDGIFQFWTSDAGWYRIDPAARKIEVSEHDDEIRREQRLWGIPAALCYMARGDFALHAAAVEVEGKAIVLAAPGRFGKTTLALAFHRRGYRLLTEDTTCCSLSPNPYVLPGPTSIRVRPDMFHGEAPSGTRVVSVKSDRIHLELDSDRIGNGQGVPIQALVFLRESSDKTYLERLKTSVAIPDLWTLNFRFQSDAQRSRSFSQLARLAGGISVWNLYRPMDVASLDAVVLRLVETCCGDV